MKSLKFRLVDNVTKALNAGCNLILHCNGRLNEMKKISKGCLLKSLIEN